MTPNSPSRFKILLRWDEMCNHTFQATFPAHFQLYIQHVDTFFSNLLVLSIASRQQTLNLSRTWLFPSGHLVYSFQNKICHDGVIKWKHFPRYWTFVRGIHRSPVNSPHKGQWRGALMFSLICVWINVKLTIVRLVIWDAISPIMTSL